MENLVFLELPLKLLYLSIVQAVILKTTVSVNFTVNISDLNPNCGFSDANDLLSPEVIDSSETKQEPCTTPLLGPF